jgi:hypothetical protein
MSIPFPGFTGPSYQLTNRAAASERLVNWYCIPNESGGAESKFKLALEPSPGNAAFCPLPVPAPFNQRNRGLLELRGTAYGVNGTVAFSIDYGGNFTNLGTVADDGLPVSMVANAGQIFIASAGNGYVIPAGGGAGSLIAVETGDFLGASYATFQDGYIIVVTPNSNQIQISGSTTTPLGDATQWDAANVSIQAGQADLLQAVISSREYLRLLGSRRSQIYSNTGNAGFPFQSYNETFIETGIAAPFSLADLGDSLIWVGQDSRGMRACWRDAGFQPQRISTLAIEQAWQNYWRVDDAIAFSYVWKGHLVYRITFPSALQGGTVSATWEYDATASQLAGMPLWSERQYLNGANVLTGRPELFHCYAYGRHLVGSGGADGNPGAIYQMSDTAFTDCGTDIAGNQSQRAIVRDRICPHLWSNNKRLIYNRIELELARGVGADGGGLGADPQILIRWSNDGGNTWSPEQQISAGKLGEYSRRVHFNRCGSGRDRIFWIRCSDPVYWAIVGAELDLQECAN